MGDTGWHALYVRRRFERVVASHLHQRNIEHYLQVYPIDRQLSELKTIRDAEGPERSERHGGADCSEQLNPCAIPRGQ